MSAVQVEVTQADRDAAADFLESVGASTPEAIKGTREGRYQVGLSQAFARHRLAYSAPSSIPEATGSTAFGKDKQ